MKFNWKTPLLTTFVLASSLFSGYSQTQNKSAFVDSIMAESEKCPTTTHFIYEIQKNSQENFHDVNKLELIIENVEKQFPKKEKYSEQEVLEIFKATDKEIKNQGLEYKEDEFDCDDQSFIYEGVDETYNDKLNSYCVPAPEHFFVRCDYFNWETTSAEILSDEYYKKWLNISEKSIENGVYMKNSTKQELIAVAYNNSGIGFLDEKNYNLAIQNFNTSIELDSNNTEAYNNRGLAFYYKRNDSLAIQDYNKSIELDPNNAKAYCNKGLVFFRKGNSNLAIQNYDKSIELDPNNAEAYYSRGYAYGVTSEFGKAYADFKKYSELTEQTK